jgi:hypothetical protein
MPVGTIVYSRPTGWFLLCRDAARNTGKIKEGPDVSGGTPGPSSRKDRKREKNIKKMRKQAVRGLTRTKNSL